MVYLNKSKVVLIKIIQVTIVLIMIWSLFFRKNLNISKDLYESDKQNEYKGVVTKKYIDYQNHAQTHIILDKNLDIIFTENIYLRIKPGDSIVKRKNIDFILLYRNNITKDTIDLKEIYDIK